MLNHTTYSYVCTYSALRNEWLQVFATTRTGRKRIFTTFPEYSYSRPWKTNKKIFHIQMDFSWSAIWVIWHIPKAREEYVSPLYVYRTMGVICVSPLPTTMNAFTCNIWQNTYEPIFPKTREYPCVGYVICTQSKYIRTYDFKIFQVEVTSVTSV